jgi:AcrR family transcriptional regulator
MTRRYRSALRDERATLTRTALLDACEALLLEGPVEDVTLPAVARRAGVTKPTAYSYFADNDALLAGFLEHVRDRIGMDHDTLATIAPAALHAAVLANYRRFEDNAQVLRRVMDSPSYNRVRLSRTIDRTAKVLPVWDRTAPKRADRHRLGPIYLLVAPASWRWLRETWGLSDKEAAQAAAWAVQTLVAALAAPSGKRAKEK